jgi:hypothetical protein
MKSASLLARILLLVFTIAVLHAPSIGAEPEKKRPTRLFVREVPLKILGREIKVPTPMSNMMR